MTTETRVLAWGNQSTPFQAHGQAPILRPPMAVLDIDKLWDHARGHCGFYGWLTVAERQALASDGMRLLDLPHHDWWRDYDDRVPPTEAADVVLDEYVSLHGIPEK